MGAQRCDLPPETHRRRPHYRRRRYRKPHQEVLRDLARCLHSHHQHQRRRRHRRHLRRRFHRRAPRRGQASARSGIASAGVRSTSRPSSVPTRPVDQPPMRRSASPGLTLFSQRAGLPPTTAWQERKTQPAPKAPAADGVPDKAVDEARLAGLPLSGGRDEEVLAAHSAHSQRCPPRV